MRAYDDLLHRQRPAAPKPMARMDRAAQFAPFAALTGYESAIREAGRLTQPQKELSEEEKADINRRLVWMSDGEKIPMDRIAALEGSLFDTDAP